MAAGRKCLVDTYRNRCQQGANKQKRGHDKRRAGVFDPAQIHDRQDGQDKQAQGQRVWLKLGQRRGHRGHAGRNPYRCREDVIDHQRRRGQQPGSFAKILARHGVAAAAAGIRSDGLPVAKKDDHQQDQNSRDDGEKVLRAGYS